MRVGYRPSKEELPTWLRVGTFYLAPTDQSGYATAVASGRINPKFTAFPFSRSVNGLKDSWGRCKHIPREIWSLFCAFKPYEGGNDCLYTLNRMSNGDKHTSLAAVMVNVGAMNLWRPVESGDDVPPRFDRAKNEVTFAAIGNGSNSGYHLHMSLIVTFRGIDFLSGHPVTTVLNAFAGEVESVLMAVEAEATRLGLA